jgi:hypothetical protein
MGAVYAYAFPWGCREPRSLGPLTPRPKSSRPRSFRHDHAGHPHTMIYLPGSFGIVRKGIQRKPFQRTAAARPISDRQAAVIEVVATEATGRDVPPARRLYWLVLAVSVPAGGPSRIDPTSGVRLVQPNSSAPNRWSASWRS